jgi:hypothetical protein
VLLRQLSIDALERDWVNRELTLHLGHGHLVQRLDPHFGIFAAVFDDYQSASWLQRADHRPRHLIGVVEPVVDVDEEDHVD